MSDQLMTTHLVIMTKFPEPGKVKTRLAAAIGDKRACQLHAAMVQHLSDNTLPELTGVSVSFHVAGGADDDVTSWLSDGTWQRQIDGDLGDKMQHALQASFDAGAEKVLIIGTDAPAITSCHIDSVISALDDSDVAFVPATDGGYVMAGMKRLHIEMLEGIEWSTDEVLRVSVSNLESKGCSVTILDPLNDVDLFEDLTHASDALGGLPWE